MSLTEKIFVFHKGDRVQLTEHGRSSFRLAARRGTDRGVVYSEPQNVNRIRVLRDNTKAPDTWATFWWEPEARKRTARGR